MEEKGYRVLIAEDGLKAIELAELKPDLVLLDIMMPRINGFDVAAVFKNNPKTKHIPIIIVSIIENRERGYQVGVEGYFTKPIDFPELLTFIEQFFAKPESA